ncbi:tyrosine-type recombinase/integrase [Sphingomonas sp.]|jgi:integrase|uniref:tyrosine-type recombinase/integrase n=1 Tax=Sphingomonas sp. TaxID=28214 RepID=UPI0035C80C74
MSYMLISNNGQRKYLNRQECRRFLATSATFDADTHTLCSLILATGCRISEALSLRHDNIDLRSKSLVIECLKKRNRGVFRTVPLPNDLLRLLRQVHGVGNYEYASGEAPLLWPFCRMTAYRRIRKVMIAAGLEGEFAMPKGLRHSFAVSAIHCQVPLNMVQRWLGHADMRTTAIYTAAIGPEERHIAHRMWRRSAKLDAEAALSAQA